MINKSVCFHDSGEMPTAARADAWVQDVGCRNPLPCLSFRAAAIPCFCCVFFVFVYVCPKRVWNRTEGYVRSQDPRILLELLSFLATMCWCVLTVLKWNT